MQLMPVNTLARTAGQPTRQTCGPSGSAVGEPNHSRRAKGCTLLSYQPDASARVALGDASARVALGDASARVALGDASATGPSLTRRVGIPHAQSSFTQSSWRGA